LPPGAEHVQGQHPVPGGGPGTPGPRLSTTVRHSMPVLAGVFGCLP
jgi:hypothetical protein